MSDNSQIETFKVVLLGESGVGKTSIISQFTNSEFKDDFETSTGGTFSSKSFTYNDDKILKFEIWDTAGQERYRALTKMFYKETNAVILVYDITRKKSFEELQNYWVEQIKEFAPENIIIAVVANKSDLSENEEVEEEVARNYAQDLNALFCTTSAKSSFGINDLFLQIAKRHTGAENIKIKNDEDEELQGKEEMNKRGTMKITKEKTLKKKKRKSC